MKRIALYLGIVAALVASCSIQEENFVAPQKDDVVFYASFEQPTEVGTRVYANEKLYLRWTADDRVSIFNKITYNQQYKFLGETGDNSGGFNRVDAAEFVTGNPIPHVVSVYPYQEATKITEEEVLTLTLSAEPHYAENTFGLGANTMVSVSSDNVLLYKNVGGYLVIKLYGEGVSVSSITLKGNNGEKLAGKATVTMPLDDTPTAVMSDDATDVITLVCDSPVALGATAEESKDFWFVVPPVTFSKGFTVTVSGKSGVFEKSTEKTVTIERNKLSKMSPIEVELSPTQPNNVIYYTSSDGLVVTPNNPEAFGANILSNEYVDGQGIITFDGEVTSIGNNAFSYCTSLAGIVIPDSVTSIGDDAFFACTSLSSITIPDSVTSIGDSAFSNCTSLASITIPDSVTSIGYSAFSVCTSLSSITIPDSVTSIEGCTFLNCTSLASITIPDSVTSIGDNAFFNCTSLASITIPDSVTSIEYSAFFDCTSLSSITIPDSVTSIGNWAFQNCSSLTSITIPDSVISLGDGAFRACSSLMSFFGKFASLDGLFLIDSGHILSVAGGSANGEVTIPDSVTSIGNYAFSVCSNLTSIVIPDSVTSIGESAFSNCTSLSSITVYPEVPPTGSWGMFRETNNAPICVPAASVEAYKTAQYWSDYADRIKAIPSGFTIKEFAQEYVKILDVWQNNVGEIVMHPDVPEETVANAHFVPATTTITVGFKTYNTADMFETALRSYLLIRGYDGLDTEKYGKNSIPALEGGAVSMSETEIPETHGYEWGSAPFNETSGNGGHLVMGSDENGEHCKVKVDILDNWAMRSLNLNHGQPINNLSVYSNGRQLDGYYGCFCSQRALITYAFFFKYMLDNNLDKGTDVSPDQIIRSELLGDEMHSPEAIDLGLPSGVKWASFNLGASKPEEYGDYYAWGETEPYYSSLDPLTWKEGKDAGYSWSSYKWCMGDYDTITKYCSNSEYGYNGFTDTKTVLDLEDDAANVNLGGSWRMPTDDEWTELRENCTWSWTTQNGVDGYLVTGPNGNSIFLPAAGWRSRTELCNAGFHGTYWSSSLSTGLPDSASLVYINSDSAFGCNTYRHYGQSVRPVSE